MNDERNNRIYIQIDWIRHGFSCANAMSSLDVNTVWSVLADWDFKRGKYARDAKLSNIGINQAQVANKKFFSRYKGFDMICCSQLRRAMETAEHLFNGIDKQIYVLPYVNEFRNVFGDMVGASATSIPTDWTLRRSEVSKETFNWMFFETLKIKQFAEPSIDNFYRRLMPLIVYFMKKSKGMNIGTENRPLKIAIVSHQRYIRKLLNIKDSINNTGIIGEQIIYDLKKRNIEKSLATKKIHSPEYIIFNGKKIVYSKGKIAKKYMSKKAIERCDILEVVDIKKLRK